MSKELDDLEKYLFNEWKQNHVNFGCDYKLEAELDKQLNNLKSVKQALQRLEQIDNANPSEALEDFKIIKFKTINAGYNYGYEVWDKIERALIKAQESEQAFDIIKEKNVDILTLNSWFSKGIVR